MAVEEPLTNRVEKELDRLADPAMQTILRLFAYEIQKSNNKADANGQVLTRILFLVFGTMVSIIGGTVVLLFS